MADIRPVSIGSSIFERIGAELNRQAAERRQATLDGIALQDTLLRRQQQADAIRRQQMLDERQAREDAQNMLIALPQSTVPMISHPRHPRC